MSIKRIEFKDTSGNWVAEAERTSVHRPWTIRYESGEEQFAGSVAQMRRHTLEALAEQGVDVEPQS